MTTATAEQPTTALAKIDDKLRSIATVKQATATACNQALLEGDTFMYSIAMADGLVRLQEAFTPDVVARISALAGKSLGFRHDREERGTYPAEVIRDCAIEALLRGLSLTGNQFNIIANRCYVTREGFQALLAQYPGLTNLEIEIGLPEDAKPWGKQELVYVTAAARCKVGGREVSIECRKTKGFDGRLAVKTFSGEVDNAKGKAQRRLLKLLYERITGSTIDEPDDGVQQAGSVMVIDHPAAQSDPWQAEKEMLQAPRAHDAWAALEAAGDTVTVQKIMDHAKTQDMTGKDRASLQRFAEHRTGLVFE